jgi:hypothetical protein
MQRVPARRRNKVQILYTLDPSQAQDDAIM